MSKKAQGDGRDERGSASLKVESDPEGFSLEGECNEANPCFQKKVGGTGKNGGWGIGYPPSESEPETPNVANPLDKVDSSHN